MSFWRNYYHIIWTTKNRMPLIREEFEDQLYGYIVKRAKEDGVLVYALNGTEDHTHIVVSIPPKHSVSEIVQRLKGASAHYVNHVIQPEGHFRWQRGYGCLTVGEKQRNIAEEYVIKQKVHHKKETTISWLEHHTEEDEGPENVASPPDSKSKFVRDEITIYDVLGESPF